MTTPSVEQLDGGIAVPGVLVAGRWSPALAPRGDRMAFVSDAGGRPQVWVQPASDPPAAHPAGGWVPVGTGPHPVLRVSWSPDGAWLGVLAAPGGAPRTEVWLVRPDGSDLHQAAGFGAATGCLGGWVGGRGGDPVRLAVTETGPDGAALVLHEPVAVTRRELPGGQLPAILDISRDGRLALLRQGTR